MKWPTLFGWTFGWTFDWTLDPTPADLSSSHSQAPEHPVRHTPDKPAPRADRPTPGAEPHDVTAECRYRLIAALLQEEIALNGDASDTTSASEGFPSEEEVMTTYRCTRGTARQALRTLRIALSNAGWRRGEAGAVRPPPGRPPDRGPHPAK
ncbi:hypothetical protein SAMN05421505_10510 [Sinosporangium album]|uniref:Uncharacterized protein n=1 Tax=Sinosporangium album TaxID=504805 RepID=A0A1G7UXN4_9ACTN|nr:hypothetical protein [Sinosporangium album]SDG52031.1 hypothetical protein SAMN05421505_10510 [Sinosporangium album]